VKVIIHISISVWCGCLARSFRSGLQWATSTRDQWILSLLIFIGKEKATARAGVANCTDCEINPQGSSYSPTSNLG